MATVLVADHHPADAEVAAALLTADGYAVRCVGDGAAALALVRRWRPDAVLTEVLLPGVDGLTLARPAVRGQAGRRRRPARRARPRPRGAKRLGQRKADA